MARRRKRRRINKGRVAALLIIILVIAAGIFFVTTRFGRTSYASVNKSMGEYMVKANDDLLGKGTDKELKKSLYVPRKIDKTKKLIAFTFKLKRLLTLKTKAKHNELNFFILSPLLRIILLKAYKNNK